MSEIKVGEKSLEDTHRLESIGIVSEILRETMGKLSLECCDILGVDPTTDSVAKDICEEIVLHGTPPLQVIAKLQRHLEQPHSADFS